MGRIIHEFWGANPTHQTTYYTRSIQAGRLLGRLGLGDVEKLIYLLVALPAARLVVVIVGIVATGGHELRGGGDSLARLSREGLGTRPQRRGPGRGVSL